MAREIRDYAGGAVDTTLSAGINSTDLSIQITDATGWPTGGANGPFFIVVSYDVTGKEKIEVASRTGTTLTVASTGKRGVDGTSAASHASGAAVRHCITAQDHDEFNSHAFDTTQDDHTQYLNNTRHDSTGRHTVGSVVPAGTPGAIAPDDTATAGVANSVARSDHRHAITAAAAGTIAPDDTAAEGAATSFSRSDHRHAITTATPVQVGTFLTEGASAFFSRSDHIHELGPGAVDTADRIADGIITLAKMASQGSTDFSASVTFTNPVGSFSLGTGGVKYANYFKLGRIVLYWVHFKLGTGGNVGAGSTIEVNLPVANTASHRGFAAAKARQPGGFVASGTAAVGVGASVVTNFVTAGASASWDALAPFNWDAGDDFDAIVVYEAAT